MRRRIRRYLAPIMGIAMVLAVAGTVQAWTYEDFSNPCNFKGGKDAPTLQVNSDDLASDPCDEVGAGMYYRVCSGCTLYFATDYDATLAYVDRPNNYIFFSGLARGEDHGVTGSWYTID